MDLVRKQSGKCTVITAKPNKDNILKLKTINIMQFQHYKKYDKVHKKTMLIGIPIIGIILTFPMSLGQYSLFSVEHFIDMVISSMVTGILWFSCMSVVKILWKKYPWHLKPALHLGIEVPLIIAISIGLMTLMAFAYSFTGRVIENDTFVINVTLITILSLFLTTFHEALFFYYQWKYNFNKSAVLEKDNVIAQYETLKNQTNPHFLFNSLNTLLTFVEDNKVASSYIQNLSDFLRYTLKSKDSEIKLLRNEIKIVEKYFFLQKSRFGKNLNINIQVPEKYYHYSLPPLSLQILVENAIKHNIISTQKPLNINIFIKNEKFIVVEHNLQRKMDVDSTNTGLLNIKTRYKFLSTESVHISNKNNKFTVELPLLIVDF